MAQVNIDTNEYPEFAPLEEGFQLAHIVREDTVATKKGDGKMLVLKWKVLDGVYKGRSLFKRFNIENPSAVAEQIAQQELAGIARTLGIEKLNDTLDLQLKPHQIFVRQRTHLDGGKIYNDIVYTKSIEPPTL